MQNKMENRNTLKERIKQMVREILAEDEGMAVNSTDNCGCEYSTPKAFKKKVQEQINQLIDKELLNEATYSNFRNEIKFRTKSEQLHKAIKEVKRKVSEIDRIVEYTSRMKQELSESEAGIKYWKATSKNVSQIQEIITQLSNKLKNLNQ
jgi:predicted transcriptional regulator